MNFQTAQDFMQSVNFRTVLITLKAVLKKNPEDRDLVKMEQGWQRDSGFKWEWFVNKMIPNGP